MVNRLIAEFYSKKGEFVYSSEWTVEQDKEWYDFDFISQDYETMKKYVTEELNEDENCVRVMSVHQSKGLEFPVVFLARAEQKINKSDLKESILIEPELGFGPVIKDRRLRTNDSTLPRNLLKLKIERRELGEEMRVLYVAMTRAKEKLIIVAADQPKKDETLAQKIEKYTEERTFFEGGVLPVTTLYNCSSYYDWLLRCSPTASVVPLPAAPKIEAVKKVKKAITSSDLERIKMALRKRESRHIPSKVSVTSLLPEGAWEKSGTLMKPPRFLSADADLSAAEKGTLFHLIMERIPLDRSWDRESLIAEISAMAAAGIINEEALNEIKERYK